MAGLAGARHLGVRVLDRGEIGGPGTSLELGEEPVVPRLLLGLRYPALGVVDVAEHDGLGRTGGLAGGADLPVADLSVLVLGVDARAVDALHAVGALLH